MFQEACKSCRGYRHKATAKDVYLSPRFVLAENGVSVLLRMDCTSCGKFIKFYDIQEGELDQLNKYFAEEFRAWRRIHSII